MDEEKVPIKIYVLSKAMTKVKVFEKVPGWRSPSVRLQWDELRKRSVSIHPPLADLFVYSVLLFHTSTYQRSVLKLHKNVYFFICCPFHNNRNETFNVLKIRKGKTTMVSQSGDDTKSKRINTSF